MTEFRKLAERIAEDIENVYLCCRELPKENAEYLKEYFKPTLTDSHKYCMGEHAFLFSYNLTRPENNSFRILILLFAEQHYLTYKK